MRRDERFAPEFQRPNLGKAHRQSHSQIHLLQLFSIAQKGHQWRVPMYLCRVQFGQGPVRIVPRGRTKKVERHWPVRQHREFTVQLQGRPLVRSSRQDTNGSALRARSDVVGPRAARLYPQTVAAPHATVVGSSNCDSTTHRVTSENPGTPAALFTAKPIANRFNDSLTRHRRDAEASIEQNRIRPHHR